MRVVSKVMIQGWFSRGVRGCVSRRWYIESVFVGVSEGVY